MRIEDAVFPNLTTPLILSDFLTDLYETGGIISLLSLNGLFYLIQNHNFDYPNFYDKLYRLLTPSIFHTKYRSKFFSLISLFLNSPHLPAYLVAAFMKKISRLCLSAPPHGCIFSIRLIFNLMRRNPPCRILIDRTSKSKTDIAGIDPFDMDEPNPSKSNALESSLWEMKSLLSHYCPDVAKEAQDLLTTEIWPLVDEDLSTVINLTFKDIFEEYLSVKPKNITFNYKKPAVLFEDTETLFSFR